MKLAAATVSALTVPVEATGYLRIIWKTYRSSPMGMGYGKTRFASPGDKFKLLYAARDLTTALAETIVRDRFDRRQTRSILEDELHERAIASLLSTAPLDLLDLRTTGATRLGVSTNIPRGKAQGPGRRFSASLYEQTDLDGILYRSRITNGECIAVYDRAASKLHPKCPVTDLVTLSALVPGLADLDVTVIARVSP